ncbi:MAG: YchF/TatD family DNA exonuclease [Magnetococcales bacterium]|nr:YchF/TatD family DNA exonuclease [Magnetococcales bacterium]
MLADSHCHLDFPDFGEDLSAVLQRAREAGVAWIHTIGTRLEQAPYLSRLCAEHSGLRWSIGIHPHEAAQAPDASVEAILAAASLPGVVGVGETGLDFHYDFSPREQQEAVFRHHIRAAFARGLPLIIHTREAEEATMRILEEEQGWRCGGVIHCFTGSPELAHWAVAQGFHLSFSGVITFKNAEPLRRLAAEIPLDRLLVETDSPYLAPIPKRGKRNEPAFVVHVAQALAEARGTTLEEVAQATTANFLRLFSGQSSLREEPLEGGDSRCETLAYVIGRNLYLNISRGCTLHCAFCPKWTAPVVHQYDLTLAGNPSARRVIEAMGEIAGYDEVVFCGYGEPTLRLEVLLEVAREVKRQGGRVRLNTDGLANRVHRRDVTPQFAGLVDAISVSLNAQDEETYNRHCQPALKGSYPAVREFLRLVKAHVPEVTASVIEGLPGVDVAACRRIAEEELGVRLRVRTLDRVG